MYGQSCRVVGRGGGGPLLFSGGFPLLGAQRDHPHPPVRGDPPVPLGPLGEAIHRPTKALAAAADGEQRVQGFAFPRARDVGVVRVVPPGVRVEAWVVWGGGVVGGEEGVGAVYHPVVSGCVVVNGGEGIVQIVHEGHVGGGGLLPVVRGGMSPGTWCRKLPREAIRATHVSRSHSLVLSGVVPGGGWAMLGSR